MHELGVDAGGEFGVTRGKIAVISKTKAKAMDLSCLPCGALNAILNTIGTGTQAIIF